MQFFKFVLIAIFLVSGIGFLVQVNIHFIGHEGKQVGFAIVLGFSLLCLTMLRRDEEKEKQDKP